MTKTEILEDIGRRQAEAQENMRAFQRIVDVYERNNDEINASYFGQRVVKYSAIWSELQDVKEMLMNMEE